MSSRPGADLLKNAPLDHAIERRLRQGSIAIKARLDLHGMRQDEAHGALESFMTRHAKAGHRSLLIITGKGRGGEGVLRSSLEGWLATLPEAGQILALRPAALKHGGTGAFYVLLRRRKKLIPARE
jgi:DNA-nicking Smr family endonuclease